MNRDMAFDLIDVQRAAAAARLPVGELIDAAKEVAGVCSINGQLFVDRNDLPQIQQHIAAAAASRRPRLSDLAAAR